MGSFTRWLAAASFGEGPEPLVFTLATFETIRRLMVMAAEFAWFRFIYLIIQPGNKSSQYLVYALPIAVSYGVTSLRGEMCLSENAGNRVA